MVNFAAETVVLSLADGTGLRPSGPGTVELAWGARTIRLKRLDPGVQSALYRLADGPAGVGELERAAKTAHPEADVRRLALELARLAGKSVVCFSCVVAGSELLRATADGPLADFDFTPPPPSASLRLSRFAYTRRSGDTMILISPVSSARVEIVASFIGALLVELARPRGISELCDALPGCGPATVRAAALFLLGTGVLAVADESGQTGDETRPGPAQRDFHDVAMHAASRSGLTAGPLGGTYRFRGIFPPAPAVRPLPDGERIALLRPDLDQITRCDPPLGQVMESRRSIRAHGTKPITLAELGEFLFRVARIKRLRGIDETAGLLYEASQRTCPSGGGCHDLEFYLTIRCCTGLVPGIYHYDPAGHQLTLVCTRRDLIRRLMLGACLASGGETEPQVLITLASRFARLSWKYEGIAYAITMKNAGVLYEAMYLAATAMGLAPCGLGNGDSAVFSAVTGLDPLVESPVGEFMLGTRTQA